MINSLCAALFLEFFEDPRQRGSKQQAKLLESSRTGKFQKLSSHSWNISMNMNNVLCALCVFSF